MSDPIGAITTPPAFTMLPGAGAGPVCEGDVCVMPTALAQADLASAGS